MAKDSNIEWTDHTWNPWVGCTKISAACDHCYAEAWSKRSGRDVWGAHNAREHTKTWSSVYQWDRKLNGTGRREKVFVASLADVFDNHKSIKLEWRADMWAIIKDCRNLDFLLLTKRPQNIQRYLPDDWEDGYANVWLGTTVENQQEAERRIPHLLGVPASLYFVSCEPLLEAVNISKWLHDSDCDQTITPCACVNVGHFERHIGWVIAGGENASNFRPSHPDWFRSLRDQCHAADVAFLFKQWDGRSRKAITDKGSRLDNVIYHNFPENLSLF